MYTRPSSICLKPKIRWHRRSYSKIAYVLLSHKILSREEYRDRHAKFLTVIHLQRKNAKTFYKLMPCWVSNNKTVHSCLITSISQICNKNCSKYLSRANSLPKDCTQLMFRTYKMGKKMSRMITMTSSKSHIIIIIIISPGFIHW
jgi:hypothetical protein